MGRELTESNGHADTEGVLVKVEATKTELTWQAPTVGKEACFRACEAVQAVPATATRRSKRPRLARDFGHDEGFCSAALPAAA